MLMGATATIETLFIERHLRLCQWVIVQMGWVRLREADSKGFLFMEPLVKKEEGMIS